MTKRRVTTAEKKKKGTFNVTRDKDSDFTIVDGLVKMNPKPPEDYSEVMQLEWHKYWRHLVKHNYGKESDYSLVDMAVREWAKYHRFREYDQSSSHKAFSVYSKCIEQLGIAPAAMAKVAVLSKVNRKNSGFDGAIKDAASGN